MPLARRHEHESGDDERMAWKTKHLHSASVEAYFEFLINGYGFILSFAVMIACRGLEMLHISLH